MTARSELANAIRALAMDAVQQANSGHPGMPMGMAEIAEVLWNDHLRHNPANPAWPNRDRFVLSCGHASALLYALLHLAGYDLPLAELERFRQLDSKTPGHPERGHTAGVETTTGPLGQGVGTSVGMAIASRWLAARYNRPGFDLFAHDVYVIASDGDLMEGVSHEAASLAGHLGLGNLCWIYDNNRITIEGSTDLAVSDDPRARFAAYGWHVEQVANANDTAAFERALAGFEKTRDRPTLIVVDSHIGYGAPRKQDTREAHGEPLGEDEVRGAKHFYGWPEDAKFLVPDGVRERFAAGIGARGARLRREWTERLAEYRAAYPDLAEELDQIRERRLPEGWSERIPSFPADAKGMATRESSGKVLNAVAGSVPWLIGGSADLAPSTKTLIAGAEDLSAADPGGRNLHFGIREHAMGTVLNGLSLSGLRPYGASFLVFSDYGRPAIRLAALMELPVIYVYTHDSIGLGEDGPTHQPIEHLASLRVMPNIDVWRPCDAVETAIAWRAALERRTGPTCLVLTRQDLPHAARTPEQIASAARGGYILFSTAAAPAITLIATGSEVQLALGAARELEKSGVAVRVVSLPCTQVFDRQPAEYRAHVLSATGARLVVEAGASDGWWRYVGARGAVLGLDRFGHSAPAKALFEHFGFTVEGVAAAARRLL